MRFVIERGAASKTVDELVFLAADGFKFTAYVDTHDREAALAARRAFLECLTLNHPGTPLERLEDFDRVPEPVA